MMLNLGCGDQLLEGYVNVDHPEWGNPDADDWHDLDKTPWPWKDDSVGFVLMDNVLEHLWDTHASLMEIHRILRPGSLAKIIVPHRMGQAACQADHKALFDEYTFRPYTAESKGRTGSKVDVKFELQAIRVDHKHPWAWHQREYLGRELIAWKPHKITYVLKVI